MHRSPRAPWLAGAGLLLVAVVLLVGLRRTATESAARVGAAEAEAPPPRAAGKRRVIERRPEVPDGRAAVRGRVVDEEGRGIEGARVFLGASRDDDPEDAEDEGETDETGAFEVRARPSVFDLTARAPGFVDGYGLARAGGEPVTLTLARGAVVEGRVVRADTGAPVPGAEVSPEGACRRRAPVRADAEGRFRMEGVERGSCRLVARAPGLYGRPPASISPEPGEPRPAVSIALHPAAELRGRLELAPTGAACPGGEVLLSTGDEHAAATADDEGLVYFPALPPGHYQALLTCAGHAEHRAGPLLDVGADAQSITFTIQSDLGVRGVLVDEAGEMVRSVLLVAAERHGEPDKPIAWAAIRNGRFELRGLEAGTYDLFAAPTLSWPPDVARPPAVTVTVAAGGPDPEVRLASPRFHHLEGHVVDQEGQPVRGARVDVVRRKERGSESWAYTSEDGHFLAGDLWSGTVAVAVRLDREVLPILSGGPEATLPHDDDLRLVVAAPTDRLQGQVLGAGTDHATMHATCRAPGDAVDEVERYTSTDAGGRFSLRVPSGAVCSLRATTWRGATAELEGARPGRAVELRLRPGGTLRGTVRGAPGLVRISLNGRTESFLATDGAWEIRGVAAGEQDLRVFAGNDWRSETVVVRPGETTAVHVSFEPVEGAGEAGEDP